MICWCARRRGVRLAVQNHTGQCKERNDKPRKKFQRVDQGKVVVNSQLPNRENAAKADGRFLYERIERIGHAITAREVAELLGISQITVYKMAARAQLPSFRIGSAVRFDPRAIGEWLRKRAN